MPVNVVPHRKNHEPRSLTNVLWRGHEFITYGKNNAYPQDCRRILEASPTGVACRNRFSDFLEGEGFEDAGFMESRINFQGQRVWQLLNQTCLDYATHKLIAIHVNYNLALRPVSYTRINPEFVRMGLPDSRGVSNMVAICADWTLDNQALIDRAKVDYVHTFDPDPEVVRKQIEAAGDVDHYKGQVYVYWGNEQEYPLAPHHSVLSVMQTETGILDYKKNNVEGGYMANHAFIFPEALEEDEAAAIKANIQSNIGPNGSKVALVSGVGDSNFQIIELKQAGMDSKFDDTSQGVRNHIMRSYNQPAILHNEFRQGALGGSTEVQDAFLLYNQTTVKHRNIIERTFRELFEVYPVPVNPSNNYELIPLTFQGNENENTNTEQEGLEPGSENPGDDAV